MLLSPKKPNMPVLGQTPLSPRRVTAVHPCWDVNVLSSAAEMYVDNCCTVFFCVDLPTALSNFRQSAGKQAH